MARLHSLNFVPVFRYRLLHNLDVGWNQPNAAKSCDKCLRTYTPVQYFERGSGLRLPAVLCWALAPLVLSLKGGGDAIYDVLFIIHSFPEWRCDSCNIYIAGCAHDSNYLFLTFLSFGLVTVMLVGRSLAHALFSQFTLDIFLHSS